MPSQPFETRLEIRRFKSFVLAAQRPLLPLPVRTVTDMLVLVSGNVNGGRPYKHQIQRY